MKDNNNFEVFCIDFFKKEGFKKSKKYRTLYKYNKYDNTYYVLNLQKSRWSNNFFINIGINYSKLPVREDWNPKIPEAIFCNVSGRAETFTTKKEEDLSFTLLEGFPNDSSNKLIFQLCDFLLNVFYQNNSKENFIANYNYSNSPLKGYAKWIKENDEN